jgi:anhydro-N-acetylmuramic acid kinase
VPYTNDEKQKIKAVFSKKNVDLEQLCLLNPWLGIRHGNMISQCIKSWGLTPKDIDLIASHGQTVYHSPQSLHNHPDYGDSTLQIGDGDHVACTTGIITISDFRQKHIAAGGEGAPLAVYGDYLIFSDPNENRVMLNIGGIANLTYLPCSMKAQDVFSSDIGPGNTIMEALIQRHMPGQYFDEGATVALKGTVSPKLLTALKDHPFFEQPMPKTTGPELFNLHYLENAQKCSGTSTLSLADTMATLNKFSAEMIALALNKCQETLGEYTIYTSGGGLHNPLLMQNIQTQCPNVSIRSTDQLAINPDAKEAVLFAVLANECVAGGKTKLGNMSAGIPSVTMGKVSFYD